MHSFEVAVEVGFEIIQVDADVRNQIRALDILVNLDDFLTHICQYFINASHYLVYFFVDWFDANKGFE